MKVPYATDGFEPALQAEQVLEKIADRAGVEVTVMSVTHAGVPAPEHALVMLDDIEHRRKDTVALVDAAAEKLSAAGFRASARTAEGHPGQEIVRAVEDDWYDLIVMGAGRRSWLGARLLGSVSSYVLHSSPWSVLIVHEALPNEGKARVLLGTDGSRGAALTMQTVAGLADPGRTEVDVVSVITPSPVAFAAPGAFYVPADSGAILEAHKLARQGAQRRVRSAMTELRNAGFEVTAHVADGSPTEHLLEQADAGDYDLVAVGSRGQGPFRRALLGSVSDHIVRHARATLVGRRLES